MFYASDLPNSLSLSATSPETSIQFQSTSNPDSYDHLLNKLIQTNISYLNIWIKITWRLVSSFHHCFPSYKHSLLHWLLWFFLQCTFLGCHNYYDSPTQLSHPISLWAMLFLTNIYIWWAYSQYWMTLPYFIVFSFIQFMESIVIHNICAS